MGVLCTWAKLLTDLQILGCELHKNAFGGRALPVPAGGFVGPPGPIAVIRGREGKAVKGWGGSGRGRQGRERGGRARLGYLSRGRRSS